MGALGKSQQSLAGDIALMRREAAMTMATVSSLTDEEIGVPSLCAGWTRAHVLAHLALDADAMVALAGWAVTGTEAPGYESREQRDADIEAAVAGASAADLAAELVEADARLADAFETLRLGVRAETVRTLYSGEINTYSLPARRTAELIVHHNDLDTTWDWHEADPDAILDAIEVCVRRLQSDPASPGLRVVAKEGEDWTVGDGAVRIEGYYETLLPYLARGHVEEGLRHDGEPPALPPW